MLNTHSLSFSRSLCVCACILCKRLYCLSCHSEELRSCFNASWILISLEWSIPLHMLTRFLISQRSTQTLSTDDTMFSQITSCTIMCLEKKIRSQSYVVIKYWGPLHWSRPWNDVICWKVFLSDTTCLLLSGAAVTRDALKVGEWEPVTCRQGRYLFFWEEIQSLLLLLWGIVLNSMPQSIFPSADKKEAVSWALERAVEL